MLFLDLPLTKVNKLVLSLIKNFFYIFVADQNLTDSCPSNYTSIGQYCYYFSDREYDWKSSASLCRGMGGHLVEFETIVENQDVISYLQGNTKLKGKNFWTGGLNPGLLWIWAGSARPIHNDTKQAVVGNGRLLTIIIFYFLPCSISCLSM